MDKGYVWQGEYGKRSHLIPILSKMLEQQDVTSLTMLALFINNNPYNLEFFIAVNYDKAEKEHIHDMINTFERAGLIYRNDLTLQKLLAEMGGRRFNSFALSDAEDVETIFSCAFYFSEKSDLEKRGYFMKPFGKDRQVFISYSTKDKEDVRKLIPYLNGIDLPVWFDEYNISVGQSITQSVQNGIEQSEMVIFWVTNNFIESKWCSTEMNAFVKKMIEEGTLIFIMLDDDVEIEALPLFLRDIKHIRRENKTVPELVEILAGVVKNEIRQRV